MWFHFTIYNADVLSIILWVIGGIASLNTHECYKMIWYDTYGYACGSMGDRMWMGVMVVPVEWYILKGHSALLPILQVHDFGMAI